MVSDSITDSELFYGSPISKKRKANRFWKLKQWKNDARHKQRIYQWKRENVGELENGFRLKFLKDKLTDRKRGSDDDDDAFSYFQAWSIDHKQGRRYNRFIKCDDYDDDDDETDFDRSLSASSPTSVLKNKDSDSNKSGDECFCCSKNLSEEEEEEVFDDAFDNWDNFSDALNVFEDEDDNEGTLDKTTEEDPNPKTRQRKKKKNSNSKNLLHKDKDNKCNPKNSPRKAEIQDDKSKKSEEQQEEQQECEEGSECPICSEKMDATDLSFLPCPCGFRVCLFCHKTINENDGRCPSCRKEYDKTSGEVSFQQRGRGTLRLSPSFRGLDRA